MTTLRFVRGRFPLSRVLTPALVLLVLICVARAAGAGPITFTFTAADVKNVMKNAYDDPLSDGTNLWGLWALRSMPIITGGGYRILGGSVDDMVAGANYWTYEQPNANLAWASPYGTEVAYFHLQNASEHLDTAAHPLYFIADQPASAFQNYAFNNTIDNGFRRSTYVGVCGIDVAADDTRCNPTNILSDAALFSFTVDLDSGASLLGWQFLVDGSEFYMPGQQPAGWPSSSLWIQDFMGGDVSLPYAPYQQTSLGGGLTHNVGAGYQVPASVPDQPTTLSLLGIGLAAVEAARRWRWFRRSRTTPRNPASGIRSSGSEDGLPE